VLVAKGAVPEEGPIRAVLAVDHSPYCDRCIDRLMKWKPEGLDSVCVLSAMPSGSSHHEFLIEKLSLPESQIEGWMAEENQKVVDKLRTAGIHAEQRIGKGDPNDVIRATMYDFGAELAILGAHGHGFIERLLIGSVSLHQVVAESYSTLLIRA
jgi:nucleotide-binding universal stress UspA family protein